MGKCDQVLLGDLFNKTTSDYNQNQRYASTRAFYSFDENTAYSYYLRSIGRKSGESLDIGVRIPIIDFPVGIDVGGEGSRAFNETEFRQAFSQWKSQVSSKIDVNSEFSVQDYYATYVRDPQSVQAWVECIKEKGTEVIGYGFRDNSGNPFLTVDWEPSIDVSEDVALLSIDPPSGVAIGGLYKPNLVLRQGDGIVFPVKTSLQSSFAVPVNVKLVDKDDFPRRPTEENLKNLQPKALYQALVVFPEKLPELPGLSITVAVRGVGDLKYLDDELAGTRVTSIPLEGFRIDLTTPFPGLGLRYFAHIESIADTAYVSDGNFVGKLSIPEGPRWLEGFGIELTGARSKDFNVSYSAFLGISDFPEVPLGGEGQTRVFSNGEFCGTRGQHRPVNAMKVWITPRKN
jgi:hypothetical protein